ncbi:MAG TPA: sialidase family protein [Kiritimatiellia bacterium]|nr:sialidase family protein [Kiritimatiellia bacterium]
MKTSLLLVLGSLSAGGSLLFAQPAPEARFAVRTPDEIRAYERDTLQRLADLSLIPPIINTHPLPKYDYDQLDYGMTLGIARTPGGRLWAAWVAGEDGPKAFMVAATSDDDGETWSKPRFVVDSQAPHLPIPRSVIVGNFWTDPSGRLWFFFDQTMNHYDGRQGVWVTVCTNPDADQPAWSKPKRIWHGAVLNKPTILANGEWWLPIEFPAFSGIGPMRHANQDLEHLRGANVFVSTDQGQTWRRRGCVRFPKPDWDEHMFVELKDGRIWMVARTRKGPMQSFSSDGGKTWTEPDFPSFKHPVARFHIRRLASGRILLVKHGETIDTHEGRSKLTAWLSEDEGQTWKGGLMLDERTGISYPDGFQHPDGTIYISYDRNRSTDGEILLARFTEADILGRTISSPRSKLKMLISRPLKNRLREMEFNTAAKPLRTEPMAEFKSGKGEIRPLEKGAKIYTNRMYTFHDLPEPLTGRRFVYSGIDSTEAVCSRAGMVYVFTPSTKRNPHDNVVHELFSQGFEKTTVPEFVYTLVDGQARSHETCSVFQKQVKVGETVRFGRWGILVF